MTKAGLDPNRPFSPRRFRFFYGWWIAAVSTVGVLASVPGQTMGVSVFTDALLEGTGLSRLGLANTYLVGTLASGFLLPYGGLLYDRYGARLTAMGACIGLALTLCFLAASDRVTAGIASQLPGVHPTAVAAGVLAFGFSALRFSGQGMLTMTSRAMLGKWFDRRRGQVAGIVGVFISMGFSLAPAALGAWVAVAGWRGAWLGMAATVGIGMTTLAWLFYRDNPEECGLGMDGTSPPQPEHSPDPAAVPRPSQRDYTRAEALRTIAFWFVTWTLAINSMVYTGITFHIVDIGAANGLDARTVLSFFIPIAIVSTTTGMAVGFAADRVRLQVLIALMALFQGVGFVGFAFLDDPVLRVLGILGWGLSGGFFGPITTVAIPSLFGRAHLGAISGAQMSCLVIGSALGPSLLAASKQYAGDYSTGLLACCGLSASALLLSVFARQRG